MLTNKVNTSMNEKAINRGEALNLWIQKWTERVRILPLHGCYGLNVCILSKFMC